MEVDRLAVTHRRILNIALPVVLANVTLPILGAVDTAVVGQMGTAAPIGAVGIGAIILSAFYWLFGFLRMGTVGLASQALGAGQHGEVAALLTRVLLLGAGGGMVFVILQQPLFWLAFQLSPASPEVENLASQYMSIRIFSAPAAIAMFGITGWLVAQERTRAVLVIQVWMNGLNIALDLWFVLGLGWGVEGVAIATFVAEWSGLALAIWLCRHTFMTPPWRDWARVFDRARLRLMWSINRDILLRSLLLEMIMVSFLFLGADFGDVTLAANQVLLQFLQIAAHGLDGIAFAAEALVGQAFGARLRGQVRRAALLAGVWGGHQCAGSCAWISVIWRSGYRHHDNCARGALGGTKLSPLYGDCPAFSFWTVHSGRNFCWSNPQPRHAQYDVCEFCHLRFGCPVFVTTFGQPWPLGGFAGFVCGAGADTWPALSGA